MDRKKSAGFLASVVIAGFGANFATHAEENSEKQKEPVDSSLSSRVVGDEDIFFLVRKVQYKCVNLSRTSPVKAR